MQDGRTPLHRAAERNTSPRVAQMLVAADTKLRDTAGMTPLDYAVKKTTSK